MAFVQIEEQNGNIRWDLTLLNQPEYRSNLRDGTTFRDLLRAKGFLASYYSDHS
ncbi:hypothetical protein [Roseimicrobium gellanilyticum]|uniref:hypothetical protein n=1 Tax=Roseimicrobium gellanilyticum TaxID=748857 RepID=UPI0014759BF2|nr:hypothetical protein [Roseimicrobium gellanilyticum]